jgi:hypothetical protein
MRKQRDCAAIFAAITHSQETLMAEYSGITICVPETEMWDYAIPEKLHQLSGRIPDAQL